jgi:Plasmid replication region DNA-binding N-term
MRKHSDEEIFAVCASLRKDGQSVTVRVVYALVGGSWPRVARLVAAFNRQHDPLVEISAAYESAVLEVQALTNENAQLIVQLQELTDTIRQLQAKLEESDANAVSMLQAAMDEA